MTDAFCLLLEKARLGDTSARDAVYGLAFPRLRRIARQLLSRERPEHTLQPTALVSELFLKLHRLQAGILDETHFFRLSARAMRQVLIDHARTRKSVERLDSAQLAGLLSSVSGGAAPHLQLAVKLAFEKLQSMDSAVARTVWARYVEGCTLHELSAQQRRQPWRVQADCDFGLQWLAARLNSAT